MSSFINRLEVIICLNVCVCVCVHTCVLHVCRMLLTPFYYTQPAAPTLKPFMAALIKLSFIWLYRSASLPVFESAAFIRHWWHSSLDLAPNQRLFNVFWVIHEIGSLYKDLWKVSHLHPWQERVWVFQAPLSVLISFFHFSRGIYLGFKMWIIITPPKHIFSLRLDFWEIECCYFKLLFVPVLYRCKSNLYLHVFHEFIILLIFFPENIF